jgi:hypothetical protein
VDELVPVILGAVLGALVWASTRSWTKAFLSIGAVVVSGITATVVSGEYHTSWVYLLLDLSEAAFGLVIGFVIAHFLLRVRGVRRPSPDNSTLGR